MYAKIIGDISNFLYTFILPALLIGAGIYFSFKTKWVQFKYLGESIKVVGEPAKGKDSMSSFQALMVSTASRVGTGNIVGVSTAICLGGAGAVFWMWVVALIGAASAFVESTLAQIYKKRDSVGGSYGGPAYYIEQGLKNKGVGLLFAVILIATYMGGFNMLASFNVSSSFATYGFYDPKATPMIIGVILAVLMALSIFGGGKKLSEITSVLVPIMSVLYISIAIIVIVKNIGLMPQVFGSIFKGAFDFKAIFGGFTGSAVMFGLKRGLYSNEAGIGSAPNAAAAADVSHPVKQGLVQMLSVYLDTIVICTATALMLLSSGVAPTPALKGSPYNVAALQANFGNWGHYFFSISLFLFGFTTLIGNFYYSEANLAYIFGKTPSKTALYIFRGLAVLIVFYGSQVEFDVAWDTSDVLMAMMALINLPAIYLLKKPAIDSLKDYIRQRKAGKDPEFLASTINMTDKTDFWN